MSKIDNILEAVLNSNVGDIFKRMDDNLVKIEEHTDKTVKALEKMVTPIEQISKAMGGMGTNAASAADKMEALNTVLNTIGQGKVSDISKISEAVAVLGKDAGSSFDTVNTLAKALNAFSNGETADLKKFVDTKGLAELNAAIKKINEQLLKWDDKKGNVFEPDQIQALVDMRDLMKEIFDLKNKSTEKREAIATKEADKARAEALKEQEEADKAYAKHVKEMQDAKLSRFKDAQDAYQQEEKLLEKQAKEEERIREEANKKRREEIKQTFAEQEAVEKKITSLLEQRLKLQDKQDKAFLKYTEADALGKKGDAAKAQAEYDKYARAIEKVNNELKEYVSNQSIAYKNTTTAFNKNGAEQEQQLRFLEQYNALLVKISEQQDKNTQKAASQQKAEDARKEADALREYIALMRQQEELEKKREPLRAKLGTSGLSQQELAYYSEINNAINLNNQRMNELSAKSREVAKYEAQRAFSGEEALKDKEKELSLLNAIQKEEADIASKKERQRKEAEREYDLRRKANIEANNAKNSTFAGAMAFSTTARTIDRERQAIEYLTQARNKLTTADNDYQTKLQQLNAEIRRHEKNIKEATGAQEQFNQQSQRLGVTMKDLASSFGVVFSVQSLVNFGRKIVETTGYFEMQHRAMQAIIQDTDKANALWDKTVRLAVKSPYKIKDLVTYTKQLSAYRIETDKLYDTTKMLADISSGLGVDMNRLILAYGQVKAANYLRGQELRQFSEAGVNILGELANYFSELQGRAISTGEVFEMVSKRMVKFEDVATVLHRLTEEGGIFFNMQEQQAETIQGQLMNLKDTFDLFMNSVGEKGKGVILGAIKGIRNALEDSEKVLTSMGIALGAVALRFTAIQAAAIRTKILSGEWVSMFGKNLTIIIGKMVAQHLQSKIHHADMEKSIILGKRLAAVEKEIATARAAGATPFAGWATIISAAAVAVGLLVQHIRSAKEEQKKLNEEINRINAESAATTTKSIAQFKELANKIRDVNTSEAERNRLMQKMKQLYGEILPERLRNIDYITKEGNAYDDAIESIKNYYLALRREKQIEATINQNEETIENQLETTATNIQREIKNVYKLDIALFDIKTALRKLRDEFDAGEVSAENYMDRLKALLQLETGLPTLNLQGIGAFQQGYGWVNTIEAAVNPLFRTWDAANEKLKEVTGRTEDFGMEMKKALQAYVFDKAIKDMNKGLDNAVASGLIGDSFRDALEFRAKNAEAYFNKAFENFQKGELFNSYNTEQQAAAKTMFETMLGVGDANGQLAKQMATKSAETIADALDGFVKKHNLNKDQIGIVQQYLIGSEDANKEYLENSIKSLENYLNDVRNIENGIYNIPMMLSAEALAQEEKKRDTIFSLKDVFKEMLEYYKKLNAEEKKSGGSGGNKAIELLNKQIDAIKNAAKQYDEYRKMYDDTTAYQNTKKEVQGLFDELNIGKILNDASDFDPTTIKDNLTRWLAPSIAAAGKAGQQAAEKYKSGLQLEFDKAEYAKNIVDKFKKDLNDAFDQLSLGDELSKLGIGRDFTKILFGVDTQSTEEIRDFVERWKSQLQGSGQFGETAEKEYKAAMEKIDDMEDKAQKERLKKYVEYTKQAMTERARIEVEGLQEIADIEKTFQKEIKKAQGNTARAKELESLMQTAIAGSKKATDEKLQKQQWEDFKSSDLYIEMFNDIGNASEKVITAIQEKLSQLRESLKDLNPSDLKEITKQIQKMQDELDSRKTPAQNFFESLKKIKELQKEGKTEENLTESLIGNQKDIEQYEEYIAYYTKMLKAREDMSKEEIDRKGGEGVYFAINNSLRSMIANWNTLIDQKKKDNTLTQDKLDEYKKFKEAAKAYSDAWQNSSNRIGAIFNDIMSNLEAFGGETTSTTQAWGDMGATIMGIVGMIPNYILLMKAAGVAANEALGVVGWILTGVELLVAAIKGIAGIKDAQIDDQIESYQRQIDKLSDAYDRLERSFDRAWDIGRMREYNNDLKRNINDRIRYLNAQMAAEQSRKSPDKSVLDDYQKQINDLYDSLEDRHNEWLERVSGFGDEGTWDDATQGFIDAWYDAFKETGDGMEGLQENFNEIIENMVKKQAALRLANAILEPLYKKINEAANDGTITNSEMDAIVAEANATFPELNEKLKAFFQSLGMFGEQAEGELDGLQKGIQGVTEQTAEIIAAYMNSIRYYVIDNNTKLGQLAVVLQDNTGLVNPMLAELRSIATRADDIYTLLNSWRETSGVPSMRVTIV